MADQNQNAPAFDMRSAERDGSEYDDSFRIDLERYWQRALELRFWLLGLVILAIIGAVVLTLL
ncbi:hypothetical protein N8940_02385, partial [Sphingomonadaceae bacterium]|nr:hypothetical protein [Sphingomonadaceae bacterium]